jgi:hypothetical protein
MIGVVVEFSPDLPFERVAGLDGLLPTVEGVEVLAVVGDAGTVGPRYCRSRYSVAASGPISRSCCSRNASRALARGCTKPAPTTVSPRPQAM